MTKTFCDICGKEIDTSRLEFWFRFYKTKYFSRKVRTSICGTEQILYDETEVCKDCFKALEIARKNKIENDKKKKKGTNVPEQPTVPPKPKGGARMGGNE